MPDLFRWCTESENEKPHESFDHDVLLIFLNNNFFELFLSLNARFFAARYSFCDAVLLSVMPKGDKYWDDVYRAQVAKF